MKITKARLKQIIQEELQALNEDKHTQSSWDDATRTKSAQKGTPGSTRRLSRAFDFFHAPKFGDPAKRAAEMADTYNRQPGKKPAAQPEAEPEDLGPGMSVDDQFVASGDTGAQQSMAVSGADVDVAETDPTVTGATQVADILSGRPEGAEGAFGDADGKEKPAKPARVARKGTGATRREINKMWKDGKIDKATWRKARRALANKGEAAARAALGGASAPEQQRDVAKKRQRKAALGGEGGYADAAEKAAEPAVAAPEAPKVNRNIAKIDQYTKAFGELTRGDMPSNRGIRKKLLDLVSNFEQQGLPRDEAVETASGVLGSRLQNRIKRLKLQPDVEKMLAARKRRAGEARGRELAATARDRGTETPSMALGRGVPGALEESVEKLTNLIAEEFKEALSENEGEKKKRKTALQRLQDRYGKAKKRHEKEPNNANRKRLQAAKRALDGEKERVAAATKRAKEAEKDRATRTAGGGTSGKPSGAK